jgi:hypothetical protein
MKDIKKQRKKWKKYITKRKAGNQRRILIIKRIQNMWNEIYIIKNLYEQRVKSNDYGNESGKCSAVIRSCLTHVQYVSATIRMVVKYVRTSWFFVRINLSKCICLCLSEWPPMTEANGGWMWSCVPHTLGSRIRVSFRIWCSFLFV